MLAQMAVRDKKKTLGLLCAGLLTVYSARLSSEPLAQTWQQTMGQIHELSLEEEVMVDNQFIHSYRDREGLWLNVGGEAIRKYAEKYGVSEDEIRAINDLASTAVYFSRGTYFFIPFSQHYLTSLKEAGISRFRFVSRKAEYLWPVQGSRITSRPGNRWGRHHDGIDIAVGIGTMVVAAVDGTVTYSGNEGAYGISVVLNHDETTVSRYGHLSVAFVKKGDKVRKGQVIGLSGNTGRSTGPHLHFEVRSLGIVLDPEMFLPLFKDYMESAMEFEQQLNPRNRKASVN